MFERGRSQTDVQKDRRKSCMISKAVWQHKRLYKGGIVKLTFILALQFYELDQVQLVLSGQFLGLEDQLVILITDEVKESVVTKGMYCGLQSTFRHFQANYVLALGLKVGIFWHCGPYFVSFLPFCLYCFLLVHQGSSVVIHRSYPIP